MIDGFRTGLEFYTLDAEHNAIKMATLHEPEDVLSWAQWMALHEHVRQVARDKVGDLDLSTVFLGFDHAIRGPVMLFETMVFGEPYHLARDRYSTWHEAAAGHARVLERLQKGETPW